MNAAVRVIIGTRKFDQSALTSGGARIIWHGCHFCLLQEIYVYRGTRKEWRSFCQFAESKNVKSINSIFRTIYMRFQISHKSCWFYFPEYHLIEWHQMSDSKTKTHQNRFRLVQLTALPRGKKRGRRVRVGESEKEGEGKWRGKEGKGRDRPALRVWWPGLMTWLSGCLGSDAISTRRWLVSLYKHYSYSTQRCEV